MQRLGVYRHISFPFRCLSTCQRTMGRIPDRWKDYSNCGKPITNVPIIAFKTPLAQKFSIQHTPQQDFVERDEKFTPDDLVKHISELQREIVVVIDLTNTFRYYNGADELQNKHRIQYEKVKCEGQKIPNDSVMENVAGIINNVIHRHGRDGTKVAGIHCTHGVNRTGYLVARYLIEWLGYEPTDAIEAVDAARGHKMEREAYLEDLRKRTSGNRFEEWEKERPPVGTVDETDKPIEQEAYEDISRRTPGDHFEEREEHIPYTVQFNEIDDSTNLWTGFGDNTYQYNEFGGPDDIVEPRQHHYQPYPRFLRGNQRQRDNYYWNRYPQQQQQQQQPRSNVYTQRRFRAFNRTNDSTRYPK